VAVVDFFSKISKRNDQSFTAHVAIACFLAAAHELMYEYLKEAQGKVANLLSYWNSIMEPEGARDERAKFFSRVVERAHQVSGSFFLASCSHCFYQLKVEKEHLHKQVGESPDSKTRNPDDYVIPSFAEGCYNNITKKATEQLMDFLSIVQGDFPCVTYFDEAHELGTSFWVLLHLVQSQNPDIRMWYVFMGTKPSFSYYSPSPTNG
jgi:hypothetical protein